MVAKKFLADVDLEDKLRAECVKMCKFFHEDVRILSERYPWSYPYSLSVIAFIRMQLSSDSFTIIKMAFSMMWNLSRFY